MTNKHDWLTNDKLAFLDPILKKVKENGIRSLDEKEKEILEKASLSLKEKKKP